MAFICSVKDILEKSLRIPRYQRPYKWYSKEVIDLLEDICTAIDEYKKYNGEFKYRIGTIIIHRHKDKEEEKLDIVDGQQRLFTLSLIRYYLDNNFSNSLLESSCNQRVSQINFHENYKCIKNWFAMKNSLRDSFNIAFEKILEVVIIEVEELNQAFQLFDSQNTRGKALDPHDLLKAYHLREMRDYPYEMYHEVTRWESFDSKEIKDLFEIYLFPILNWSKKEKTETFSSKHIDHYKGISEQSTYTYAKRTRKANPFFQIPDPITSGQDFFEMVCLYLVLLNDCKKEIDSNGSFEKIKDITRREETIGFKYAVDLFWCVLLCYYDRFHNFDEQAVKKLFIWSMMLRVDMENLGFDSINKYAIGEYNYLYTNVIPMFSVIRQARFHTDISNLLIRVKREKDQAKVTKWNVLYNELKSINGDK